MLEAGAVSSSSSAVITVAVAVAVAASFVQSFPLRRGCERCGDESAEGVGPHWSCEERDAAVGEAVAERCDGVKGVVAEFVFADGVVEDLYACQ